MTILTSNLVYSSSILRRWPQNEDDLKIKDDLKSEEGLKNEDDLKIEDNLKNEDDLKIEDNLKKWRQAMW